MSKKRKIPFMEESRVVPYWRILHKNKMGKLEWLGKNKFMNKSTAQGLVESGVFEEAELWEFEEIITVKIKGQIL